MSVGWCLASWGLSDPFPQSTFIAFPHCPVHGEPLLLPYWLPPQPAPLISIPLLTCISFSPARNLWPSSRPIPSTKACLSLQFPRIPPFHTITALTVRRHYPFSWLILYYLMVAVRVVVFLWHFFFFFTVLLYSSWLVMNNFCGLVLQKGRFNV